MVATWVQAATPPTMQRLLSKAGKINQSSQEFAYHASVHASINLPGIVYGVASSKTKNPSRQNCTWSGKYNVRHGQGQFDCYKSLYVDYIYVVIVLLLLLFAIVVVYSVY